MDLAEQRFKHNFFGKGVRSDDVIQSVSAQFLNFLIVDSFVFIEGFWLPKPFRGRPIKPILEPKKLGSAFNKESGQKIRRIVIQKQFLVFFEGDWKDERIKTKEMASRQRFALN